MDDARGLPQAPGAGRWMTLVVATISTLMIVLDTTVLNVSIPTILRDFHTDLPSVQWVITGYALTFGSLLIVSGRLGDIFGHRRMFVIGSVLFAVGSLIAAVSQNVVELVIGEAIIEGIGASMIMPSTLAIISNSFEGRDRVRAFGAWGAIAGGGAALGPVVGGLLTTNASWRWCFLINVIVMPFAVVGAKLFMPRSSPTPTPTPGQGAPGRRGREAIDVQGAALIATAMFLIVFALSQGPTHGWIRPLHDLVLAGRRVWPSSMPVSIVPVALAIATLLLLRFVRVERAKEAGNASPLFPLSQLRVPNFRWGLAVMLSIAIGQLSLSFTLPLFLQEGKQLSAQTNGLWQLPMGAAFIVGAQLGSRLALRYPLINVVRGGLVGSAAAFAYVAIVLGRGITFWQLLIGLAAYGISNGCVFAQLTNIVLADVDRGSAGAASAANNTAKQVGNSIGIAIIGSLLASRLASGASSAFSRASALSPGVRRQAVDAVRSSGVGFHVPTGASASEAALLHRLFADALAHAGRVPLFFSAAMSLVSLALTALLPASTTSHDHAPEDDYLELALGVEI